MKTKKTFKRRFIQWVIILVSLFVVMLVLRLIYGYMFSTLHTTGNQQEEVFSSFGDVKRNYATEKSAKYDKTNSTEMKMSPPVNADLTPQEVSSESKYEKTATLKSKSSQYDKDDAAIRKEAKRYDAIIQYERKLGNKGNRELHLLIGVSPERFDSLYNVLQKIGQLKINEVMKVDKTNEYRKLMAEKQSYERIVNSLNELKNKGGQIKDYIALQDKILEVETNMQDIGVRLGDFKTDDQFCTIKFSLLEGSTEKKVSGIFWTRMKISLVWTFTYYPQLLFALACLAVAAFFLLLSIDKGQLLLERW
ncbi:MAG: DUF4349 domain-containing protein, partial [Bacteroidota bacterium]